MNTSDTLSMRYSEYYMGRRKPGTQELYDFEAVKQELEVYYIPNRTYKIFNAHPKFIEEELNWSAYFGINFKEVGKDNNYYLFERIK